MGAQVRLFAYLSIAQGLDKDKVHNILLDAKQESRCQDRGKGADEKLIPGAIKELYFYF